MESGRRELLKHWSEMAMCPGARKDKGIDGREMLETHMKRKIRKRWKKGYGNGSGRRRI